MSRADSLTGDDRGAGNDSAAGEEAGHDTGQDAGQDAGVVTGTRR